MGRVDLYALAADETVPWIETDEALCRSGPSDFRPAPGLEWAAVLPVMVDGEYQEILLYTADGSIGSTSDLRTLLLVADDCSLIDSNI